MNWPATSKVEVHLLEVINEITEEMDEKEENADEADLIDSTEETIDESPELSKWPIPCYQSTVYFAEITNNIKADRIYWGCYSWFK